MSFYINQEAFIQIKAINYVMAINPRSLLFLQLDSLVKVFFPSIP